MDTFPYVRQCIYVIPPSIAEVACECNLRVGVVKQPGTCDDGETKEHKGANVTWVTLTLKA